MSVVEHKRLLQWSWMIAVVSFILSSSLLIGCDNGGSGMTFVDYKEYAFSGDGKTFDRLWIFKEFRDIGTDVYVRNAQGDVYNVRELQEEVFEKWVAEETDEIRRHEMKDRGSHHGKKVNFYRHPDRSLFFFDERGLIDCNFGVTTEGPFAGIEVGKSKDGEFLKLPASREDLVRVFGKPTETSKANVNAIP